MSECPVCNWEGEKFLPYEHGPIKRDNAICPACNSKERHRLLGLYLRRILQQDGIFKKILHIAPEEGLANLLKSYDNISYISADLNPERGMVQEDITHLSFPDNNFDIILCVDVLEHISDDFKAMKELYRVLNFGKIAILQVPIMDSDTTFEDPTITSPIERENFFFQKDHVRVYGRDYRDRLRRAGFDVMVDRFIDFLEETIIKKYGLIMQGASRERHYINVCTK